MDKENLDEGRTGSSAEEIEHLQFNDPRATDFRNYLRNWLVELISLHYLSNLNCVGSERWRGRPFTSMKYTRGYIGHPSIHAFRPWNPFPLLIVKS